MATQAFLQQAYLAYFGRPADVSGSIAYANKSNAEVLNAFSASPESVALYGTGFGPAQVNAIYQVLFGRPAEAAGLTYWTTEVAAGRLTPAAAALGILTGAQNADAVSVSNKIVASAAFTAALDTNPEILGYSGDAAAASARTFLGTVTATAATQAQVDAAVVAAVAVGGVTGQTFTLTAGADTIVGTSGNDIINALTVDATGLAKSTLTAFDSIDGGSGSDILNIYSNGVDNAFLAATTTVKNVETVNVFNSVKTGNLQFGGAAGIDASKFVGTTLINQIGAAASVTGLAAATTAGFKTLTANSGANALSVTADATSTKVTVTLDAVNGAGAAGSGQNVTGLNVAGAALNSVVVSGNIVQNAITAAAPAASLALKVTAGKEVETVSVNSSLKTSLTVAETAATVKHVSTIDSSASTGAITIAGGAITAYVNNITTGSGADTVTLATLDTSVTKASVSTGAGNDTINLTIQTGVTYNINAGAGDDKVAITGTVKTTDIIDGGDGIDTVAIAGKAGYVTDDYIVYTKVLKSFEALQFTGNTAVGTSVTTAGANLDASQLASYKSFTFDAGGFVTKVAADQALVTAANLTAVAAGYVAGKAEQAYVPAGADPAANPAIPYKAAVPATYAGALNITDTVGAGAAANVAHTISASAASVALNVKAGLFGITSGLAGDLQTATVTLTNSVDSATAPTADTIAAFGLGAATSTGTAIAALTTLTLSGNGSASVFNGATDKLVTVDASGLGGTFTLGTNAGKAIAALSYNSVNAAAETIKLGAGLDTITLGSSLYGKADTVTGLNLVLTAAGTALDTAKSDTLKVTGMTGAVKFTTTQTDLDLALKDAAAYSSTNTKANLVFQLGGDTYVYHDVGNVGQVDAADTVVHLVGAVNLDALILSLA